MSFTASRRVVTAVAVTVPLYLAAAVGSLLLAPWPRRREAWRSRMLRCWARSLVRVLGMRVERSGAPPGAPFLLVANHLSYVDILVLGSELGGTFVTKAEIDRWPVLGSICRAAGMIFVDRTSRRDLVRVRGEIEEKLAAGRGVVLFIEGTTGPGRELLPFRPSLLEGAARDGYPVHWATLSYRTPEGAPPAVDSVCWYGGEGLATHVRRLVRLPRFTATVRFGVASVTERDRKRLADRLRREMEAGFEPTAPATRRSAP